MSDISRRILILFAHPAFERSRVNRILVEAIRSLPGVTFHDLYEAYPDFGIDVAEEQALLLSHDLLIFQHPFFWYSTPAILKEWQDLVLEHGWAYGARGTALQGKMMMSVITTGGRESAYHAEGHNRFTMQQLLAPLEQTARLCGMEFLPPFITHGTHRMTHREMEEHGRDLRRVLEALRDDRIDLGKIRGLPRINSDLSSLLENPTNTHPGA